LNAWRQPELGSYLKKNLLSCKDDGALERWQLPFSVIPVKTGMTIFGETIIQILILNIALRGNQNHPKKNLTRHGIFVN
jgi:hypothetical protein